jgi:hypothetical protein
MSNFSASLWLEQVTFNYIMMMSTLNKTHNVLEAVLKATNYKYSMMNHEVITQLLQSSKLGGSPMPVPCKIVHGRIKWVVPLNTIEFNKHDVVIFINGTWQKYTGNIGWLFKITRLLKFRFWPTRNRNQPSQGNYFAL